MAERKYTGILATRPVISIIGAGDEHVLAKYTAACLKRDEALFDEFNIDPKSECAWKEMAFALAERHVPAYGAKRKGRPSKNSNENVSILLRWRELKLTRGSTDTEAIRIIAEAKGLKISTIAERIKEIKRSKELKLLVQLLDSMHKAIGTEGMINAFDTREDSNEIRQDQIEARLRELSRPPYK